MTNKCYVISKYVSQTPSKTASMRVKLGFHYAGDCPATTHSIEEFDKVQRSWPVIGLTCSQLPVVVGPTYVKNVTYEILNMFKKITGDPGLAKLSK